MTARQRQQIRKRAGRRAAVTKARKRRVAALAALQTLTKAVRYWSRVRPA